MFLEIFFEALEKGHYKCFLKPKTFLPMIYIDDCIQATVSLKYNPLLYLPFAPSLRRTL